MKHVWCPETAEKAYLDTAKLCGPNAESSAAEFISAMAGGRNAKLIVEAWSNGGSITSSIGLSIAAHHSGGRHVCIVPDERSRLDYICALQSIPPGVSLPELVAGEAEELLERLVGIDFLVVDGEHMDFSRIFSLAKLSHLGAVLMCKNTSQKTLSWFKWSRVLDSGIRVVRSLVLPNGLDIAYVAATTLSSGKAWPSRWVRHIDQQSGEEHVFRR